MKSSLALTLLAISAAWVYLLKHQSLTSKTVPVQEAAAKLREAWANNHTTA